MEKSVAYLSIRGWIKPFSRDKHVSLISLAAFRTPEGQLQAKESSAQSWQHGETFSDVSESAPYMTPTKSSFPPVVPFLLAPFSLFLSIGPGKQTRKWLHTDGRWINPVVLFFHEMHETTFQTSLMLLSWSFKPTNYELTPGFSLH